jgi:hypothetical protein
VSVVQEMVLGDRSLMPGYLEEAFGRSDISGIHAKLQNLRAEIPRAAERGRPRSMLRAYISGSRLEDTTPSYASRMQRPIQHRFSATLGEEPEVEVRLV